MRKGISLNFLFLFIASLASAQNVQFGYHIKESPAKILPLLRQHPDLTVDHLHKNSLEVYGPEGTYEFLRMQGWKIAGLEENEHFLASYPKNVEILSQIENVQNECSDIMAINEIGKSVMGERIVEVKFSQNPGADLALPEVKYIANMHGNEIVGRELMVRLIRDLCREYTLNPRIKNLIDNTEISIVPSMNPDGADRQRRGNANYIDLNRNFPDWTTSDSQNNPQGRQVETQLIMNWQRTRNFALSANFHGGAVVVNYPWDTEEDPHPFEDLVKDFSSNYANLVPEMRDSTSFPGGIVRGIDWYEVNGGMQDWSYHWHNDLQITSEVSGRKWPAYSTVENYYKVHKEPMIDYLQKVHQGAGFTFNNINVAGEVEIFDSHNERIFKSYFSKGEFYKVLPTGKYAFQIKIKDKTYKKDVEVKAALQKGGPYFHLEL